MQTGPPTGDSKRKVMGMIFWKEKREAVQAIVGEQWNVHLRENEGLDIQASPKKSVYGESQLTFALLQKIVDVCGTKNVNCVFDNGFGGTETTGGDPANLTITVRE